MCVYFAVSNNDFDDEVILMENKSLTVIDNESVNKAAIGSPWYFCVIIILNAAVGAGMLAFSHTYHQAGGLIVALPIQFFLALLSIGTLIILTYCADRTGCATYQELVRGCCGDVAFAVCTLLLALYTFACCLTYLIVIGDQWQKVFELAIADPEQRQLWYADRNFILPVSAILIIYPMLIPDKINFLRYPSTVGVSGLVYIIILVIVKYFTDRPEPGPVKTGPDNWHDVFLAFPAIIFAFQYHVSGVRVYEMLRERPNIRLFSLATIVAISIAFTVYTLVGVFGYLSFGSNIDPNILLSYPPSPEIIVGIALLAIKIYTNYPLMHMVGRSALETVIVIVFKIPKDQWVKRKCWWNVGAATVWFILSLVGALFIPNIGLVIGLIGGLASLFVVGFPGLCLWYVTRRDSLMLERRHHQKPGQKWLLIGRLCLSAFLMLFSVFIFTVTTYQAIKRIVKELG